MQSYKQLHIDEKRRELKGEGEVKDTRLNSELQITVRRDKKVFLNEQCKEIEENKRMGKTIEMSSRKLEISCKDGHNKGQKRYGPNRSRRY